MTYVRKAVITISMKNIPILARSVTLLLLSAFFLGRGPSWAAQGDTDATVDQLLEYYPLRVGNWWKYKCSDNHAEVTTKIVVSKITRKDGEVQAWISFVPPPKRENARLLVPILEEAITVKADGLYSHSSRRLSLKAPPEADAEWTDESANHMVQKYYEHDSEDGLPPVLRGQDIKDIVGIAGNFDLGSSVKLFVKGIGLVNSSYTILGNSTICDLVAWKKPEVKKNAANIDSSERKVSAPGGLP